MDPYTHIGDSVMQQPDWVRNENPQAYDESKFNYVAVKPMRHTLGVVGGNEVSLPKGNITDLESDLKGITRHATRCDTFKHQMVGAQTNTIERKNRKTDIKIDTTPVHLPSYQMWGYPTVMAPEPLKADPCFAQNMHKY
jgi:hypothetical protein